MSEVSIPYVFQYARRRGLRGSNCRAAVIMFSDAHIQCTNSKGFPADVPGGGHSGFILTFLIAGASSNSPPVGHSPHNASRTNDLHKLIRQSAISTSEKHPVQTHLLMPTQQHTHSLSTALRTTKTPTSNLCETSLLRRKTFTRRCSTSRLTLAHALVEVLHKSVADLRTALRLVDALQDGRHFRLPY